MIKLMDTQLTGQKMMSQERERLKSFARDCESNNDIETLSKTLIMMAHWFRQGSTIAFTEYASQWAEAQKNRTDGNASTEAMQNEWQLTGRRCIEDGGSDYWQQGITSHKSEDWINKPIEGQIIQALNWLIIQFPHFSTDGLATRRGKEYEHQPQQLIGSAMFYREVESCLRWLVRHNLMNAKTKQISKTGYTTSYKFKHIVERENANKFSHTDEPFYIRNVAFIVAMVIAGYKVCAEETGSMNALFNISKAEIKNSGILN
ncbi:hypothetical protein [Xenorhabdus ehlersii]|uniref:Uncharacterized protein n=1 Tax=Xenorhabdus ehlersii TaxID=290111 RepID=A0A2D0ING6_9GAMM|nr:hypothetical protein [Xenorhabdus ehlersii]PHM23355.1 hypothetical protein Xehl_02884 [Xenorhabdus ehlersii]RKE93380.1 hypothetical protein BDE27_1118 [Xenorhabdus ehlersii]